MANGVITGKEVFSNVVEEAKKVDDQLKNVLGSYKAIIAELQNFKTANQGNDALKKRIELDEKAIAVEKKLIQVEKERANALTAKIRSEKEAQNAIAASERAKKAQIQTQSAQITLDKRLATSGKRLNSFYKQQSALLNELRDKYKSLNLRKTQGQKLSKAESAALKQLEARVRSLDAALKKADAEAGQFNRNVGNYPKGLRLAAGALRSFIGAFGFTSGIFLFASAIKNALNRVREFDKSMQNLAGILRTNRSALADVEKEIIKVAGSSIKTSREVANLAEALATLGLRGEALKDLIKPANDLAIGLETSSAEAAEFLVQNLNAFGESSDKAAEYADTIATIRTSTSLDFQRMRDSFQYLLPISRILGRDLAYTGGIIGLLNDNAIKAEQGARLLGTAQQKLAKDGLSLNDAMLTLNKAVEDGKSGQEQLAIASDLVGKQAAKVIVTLANNADAIEEYAQKIRDGGGALEDLVNEQLKSLDAQIKILDSTWERLILTIENGEGSYARFFKGVTLGITGYLEELIAVEEAQNKVFKAQVKPIEDQIAAQLALQKQAGISADEYERLGDRVKELTEELDNLSENSSQRGNSFLNGFGKVMTLGLVDINREFDKLVDVQREFDRQLSGLDRNTSIQFLEDEFNKLTVQVFENNKLTKEQRALYVQQRNAVGDVLRVASEYRAELIRTGNELIDTDKKLERYRDRLIDLSNDAIQEFIDKNRNAAFAIKQVGDAVEDQPNTIKRLREEVKQLTEVFETTTIGTEDFTVAQNALIKKQKELRDALSALRDSRKKQRQAIAGTISGYEKEISKLQDKIKWELKNREEIIAATRQIEEYRDKINDLTSAYDRLIKIDVSSITKSIEIDGIEVTKELSKDLSDILENVEVNPQVKKELDDIIKIFRESGVFTGEQQSVLENGSLGPIAPSLGLVDADQQTEDLEGAANVANYRSEEEEKTRIAKEQAAIRRGILSNTLKAAQDVYGLDLQSFIQIAEDKEFKALETEEKIQAFAQASQQTLLSLSDALLSGTINRLNQEEEANRAKLQTVLDDESATQDEKDEAQKRYDAENLKIRQKQFKAEQDSAIANAIINGAVAVLQAYAQLGPVGGTIAAALIAGLTAFQITNIKKQKPPQFFKGKKATDNFEGWGTVGEKGKEVIISGDGTTEVTPRSTTPRFIKKDDIIIPSISQYDREMKDPTSDTFKRVNQKLISDTNFRTNMVVVHNNNDFGNLEDRIEGAIQKGFKRANIVINQKPEKTRRTRFAI